MSYSWKPTSELIYSSNIGKAMNLYGFSNYHHFWKWSVQNKTTFWRDTIEKLGVVFSKDYQSIVDLSDGSSNAKWCFDSELNIVDSCFQNDSEAVVFVFPNEENILKKITQKELLSDVNKSANGLANQGLFPGDVVAIDMPMTYESVVIYLAGIKAGLQVATIADSFTSEEIAVRVAITKPKLIFTQDCIRRGSRKHPLYERVVAATSIRKVVVKTISSAFEIDKSDLFWDDFLSSEIKFTSVKMKPDATTTILFSSGTTGEPKAIPWNHMTPIKSASDGYYHHNIQKNDVVCWPTNLGWMMGPWLVFATLINKGCIALYTDSPMKKEFGAFVEATKVNMLGVVPSIVKNWKQSGTMEAFDWSAIKCFSSTGEVSNPEEMEYLMQLANHKPIIEYCGGTEIGGGYIASTVVQENFPSQFSSQTLGGEFVLLDENNKLSKKGEVFICPPILGLSTKLLNKNHFETYYQGVPKFNDRLLRRHGDELTQLENGYYKARGRVDDAMNLGGIKVSAVQIEAVINQLSFVKESAAIGVSPVGGGPSKLVVYYVSNSPEEPLALAQVQKQVKEKLNPLFKVEDLLKIDNLPRTASNKIMRKVLRGDYEKLQEENS